MTKMAGMDQSELLVSDVKCSDFIKIYQHVRHVLFGRGNTMSSQPQISRGQCKGVLYCRMRHCSQERHDDTGHCNGDTIDSCSWFAGRSDFHCNSHKQFPNSPVDWKCSPCLSVHRCTDGRTCKDSMPHIISSSEKQLPLIINECCSNYGSMTKISSHCDDHEHCKIHSKYCNSYGHCKSKSSSWNNPGKKMDSGLLTSEKCLQNELHCTCDACYHDSGVSHADDISRVSKHCQRYSGHARRFLGVNLALYLCVVAWILVHSTQAELTTSGPGGFRNYSMRTSRVCYRDQKKEVLHIGGIFPMTGGWAGGKGCRPAVDMALEDVNCRNDILPNHRLDMLANDSQCMPGLGMNVLYELLYQEPTKLMLLGPGCSVVSTFVGQAAQMWNLVVLSYGSSSPALSNRKRFPTFFRTHPSATLHNPTRVKLFQRFKWTRIATIQETQEVFTSTIEDLEERVKHANIEIAVRTSFLMDPKNAVRDLKRQDARVIVGLFYEDMARRVFCEVYKQKMYGPKHVWFIIGWYPDNWWAQDDPSTNCSAEQMKEALQGHITTEGMMINPHLDRDTYTGMTASTFQREIKERIGGSDPLSVTGFVEAPLAYDAVWALALALNKTQSRLERHGRSLKEFDYTNTQIRQELYSAMNSTNFEGVSGQVAFNSEGDRITWTQIEQMWNGTYYKLGIYDFGSDDLRWYDVEKWPGDKIPQDHTIIVPVLRTVSPGLFIAVCLFASLGIVASILLLAFNMMHQHRRYIKHSQPHVNSTLLVGCIVCFSCIYLQGLDGRYLSEDAFESVCQARVWVLCVGFTLAYGSMFSKVWTIYRLTTRRKKEIKAMRDWEMYLVMGIFLIMDFVLMTVWQVMDPLRRELESFPHEKPQDLEKDEEIKPQLEHCSSVHMNIWLGVTFGYKGILLLFGILLAYETRNVKVKQINDSKFVGMSIYNVVVLCIITGPVTLIIGSHQDASFAFVSVAILLSGFLAMGLIFVPKILEIQQNPRDGAESTALTDSNASREEEERHQRLLQENEDLKKQIAEKEDRIKDLSGRLTIKPRPSHTGDQTLGHVTALVQQEHNTPGHISQRNSTHNPLDKRQSPAPPDPFPQPLHLTVNAASLMDQSDAGMLSRLPTTNLANQGTPRSPLSRRHVPARHDINRLSGVGDKHLIDNNSDSAFPPSVTRKSSRASNVSEEIYSESYC